jgi:hypothetical protein
LIVTRTAGKWPAQGELSTSELAHSESGMGIQNVRSLLMLPRRS